jgi:hypothetical protein
MYESNFLGKSGFTWWIGKIVNTSDPLGIGRCQVRIYGFHGDPNDPMSQLNIPDSDLPWALSIYPTNSTKTFSAPTPNQKDLVVGFFLDGESAQQPIMWGMIPGFRNDT